MYFDYISLQLFQIAYHSYLNVILVPVYIFFTLSFKLIDQLKIYQYDVLPSNTHEFWVLFKLYKPDVKLKSKKEKQCAHETLKAE